MPFDSSTTTAVQISVIAVVAVLFLWVEMEGNTTVAVAVVSQTELEFETKIDLAFFDIYYDLCCLSLTLFAAAVAAVVVDLFVQLTFCF